MFLTYLVLERYCLTPKTQIYKNKSYKKNKIRTIDKSQKRTQIKRNQEHRYKSK